MSRRLERLASLIRRVVADEIQFGLNDPRISRMTSVTRVEVSPDLALAKVHVSVMGSRSSGELSLRGLRHAAGRVQRSLARQVRARQCPRLHFVLDESLKRAFEVVQMIDREMAELGTRDSGLGTQDSGLGTRDSGLGTQDSGLGVASGDSSPSPDSSPGPDSSEAT